MDYQAQYGQYGQQQGYQQASASQTNGATDQVALGWDDEVEERQHILLPEGEYAFHVEGFDREMHNGTDKMPPCNVANVHIVIKYNGEDVKIDKKLFLLNTNGQLFAFFKSIGAPVLPDGRIKMNWQSVPGANGRLVINHRTYNGNKYNQIKSFVDPTKADNNMTQGAPTWQGGRF